MPILQWAPPPMTPPPTPPLLLLLLHRRPQSRAPLRALSSFTMAPACSPSSIWISPKMKAIYWNEKLCYICRRGQRCSFKRRKLFEHCLVSVQIGCFYFAKLGVIKMETSDPRANLRPAALPTALLLIAYAMSTALSLELHFYRSSCPRAEAIVKSVVTKHFQKDPSIPAGLLRLHFHDCFIRGCDASVLLDSTDDNIAEKEAPPNLTLRAFDVIDDIKDALERECRGVVSCADVLALATRDGVSLSGGAAYALPTGRRDGTVSTMSEVHIPGPDFSVQAALAAFQTINLDLVDLATLLGSHGVGFCHCGFFVSRLYNFLNTSLPDPNMGTSTLNALRQKCPPRLLLLNNLSQDTTVFMNQDTSTPFALDTSFYRGLLDGKATLQLDQELAFTDVTNRLAVRYIQRPKAFIKQFSRSMVKLGMTGVLSGQEGEVRLNCRRVNGVASNKLKA
ncbi:peroxidase 57-like [Iris pallida]|uniref:Peroxidase 1 n=1 Tax=Iris pallida TaxID=29817 RepID=A0AAX6HP07_IRIPA|nr:peroxidase 57-like [Iris pallida]